MYDAAKNKDVIVTSQIAVGLMDNSMASEFCHHMGAAAKENCRFCRVRPLSLFIIIYISKSKSGFLSCCEALNSAEKDLEYCLTILFILGIYMKETTIMIFYWVSSAQLQCQCLSLTNGLKQVKLYILSYSTQPKNVQVGK